MALNHTFVSGKTDGADGTLVQPSKWNEEHVADTNGLKMVSDATVPSAPSSGYLSLYGKTIAGAELPAVIGASGLESALQPLLHGNRIGLWASIGNTSGTPTAIGINPPSTTGSLTARNVATTNLFVSQVRSGYLSSASAGNSAGPRLDKLQFWRGNGASLGGFLIGMRFGCADAATVASARSFVGLVGVTTALGNSDPSSNTNIIGVGTDSGDTNFSLMTNDGSGTATKTSLGANFPDHTLSVDLYELWLFCAPNSSSINVQLTRLNTGDVYTASVTSDLPANTQLLAPQAWRNNGPTALAVGQDFIGAYFGRAI